MARGRKTGGKNFEKGHPPFHIPKPMAPEVKRLKVESKEAVAKLFWELLHMSPQEIEIRSDKSNWPNISIFEFGILSALVQDAKKGKTDTLRMMKETVIGKPREIIQLEGKVNVEKTVDVSKLTDDELQTLLDMMAKARLSASAQNT